ncbi:MAG TPA: NAD(P)-dependent oxidoreductase [Sphingomonas sp.]|nr:NAD(P)-dependent oxidoreductase [Sphingomonas sp.]
MTLHSLPVFLRLAGRPVMLIGEGDSADAKRRLLERAGAMIVGESDEAALAIVALDDLDATVARLKARGLLVNAVDRPDLCDFTLPAIIDRSPVIVAIGTGGASAGLAAALRQRLEAILPASLGDLAQALHTARARLRERFPKADERRRALGRALSAGGPLDPLHASAAHVEDWLTMPVRPERAEGHAARLTLSSPDPDDLTLRQARLLAQADRVVHTSDVPTAILDRARADAPRIVSVAPPVDPAEGLTVFVEIAR